MKGNTGSARLATGQIVEGTIRYVAPVADESTRTFRVELTIGSMTFVGEANTRQNARHDAAAKALAVGLLWS